MSKAFRQRQRLYVAQEGKCFWCGELMMLLAGSPDARHESNFCTTDHLIDRWDADQRGNPVAACFACNNGRNAVKVRAVQKFHGTCAEQ